MPSERLTERVSWERGAKRRERGATGFRFPVAHRWRYLTYSGFQTRDMRIPL